MAAPADWRQGAMPPATTRVGPSEASGPEAQGPSRAGWAKAAAAAGRAPTYGDGAPVRQLCVRAPLVVVASCLHTVCCALRRGLWPGA